MPNVSFVEMPGGIAEGTGERSSRRSLFRIEVETSAEIVRHVEILDGAAHLEISQVAKNLIVRETPYLQLDT